MNLNKGQIRKQFDRHANDYDQYAHVQRALADNLIEKLDSTKHTYTRILEIGCGTGYLTEGLIQRYPKAKFVLVDMSEAMIAQTQKRLNGGSANIEYITEDAENLVSSQQAPSHHSHSSKLSNQSFDLIVSNAAFQWFNHPRETIRGYLEYLRSHGVFAFATFGQRTFHELHSSFEWASQKLSLPFLRRGQIFHSMAYWSTLFTKEALEIEIFEEDRIEFFPCVRDFLHSVKKVGASNAIHSANYDHAESRAVIEWMEKYYTDTYSSKLGIQATYQLSGGIYKKY